MLERTGQILRIACLVLAAIVMYELVRISLRGSLLSGVAIPALPTLASDTNAPAGGGSTNALKSAARGTNAPGGLAMTNTLASTSAPALGTNLASPAQIIGTATNPVANIPPATNAASLNVPPTSKLSDSVVSHPEPTAAQTNSDSKPDIIPSPGSAAPKVVPSVAASSDGSVVLPTQPTTNFQASASGDNTNSLVFSTNSASNALAKVPGGSNAAPPAAMAMAGARMNSPGMPGRGQPLPPEIKARVDRIYESEVLGQIIRIPIALLGIAGDHAIIRSTTGQTGLVKEGDSLGEVKLLRIGTNRVLVQQEGRQQELMIFNGYGGTSLLTNANEIPK